MWKVNYWDNDVIVMSETIPRGQPYWLYTIKEHEDATQLRADLTAAHERIKRSTRNQSQLIDERDCAEDALKDMYFKVFGKSPEYSCSYQFEDAVESVANRIAALERKNELLIETIERSKAERDKLRDAARVFRQARSTDAPKAYALLMKALDALGKEVRDETERTSDIL